MKSNPISLVGLIFLLSFGGCASRMTVKRVENGERPPKGLRYHLPQPYIVVYGGENGEAVVEHVTLPDAANEYAISTKTLMSKYNFGISIDRGMLKDIEYAKDDTDVAKAVVEQILGTKGAPEDGGLLGAAMNADTRNRAQGAPESKDFYASTTTTWGPVWYRVVDTGDCVYLDPVCFQLGYDPKNANEKVFSPQRKFETINIPAPKKKKAANGVNGGGGDQPPKNGGDGNQADLRVRDQIPSFGGDAAP